MIAQWMLAAVVIGALLTIAGHCIAGLQTRLGFARRWLWLSVMVISIAAPIGLSLRGNSAPPSARSSTGQALFNPSTVGAPLSDHSSNPGATPCCMLVDGEAQVNARHTAASLDIPILLLWALLSLSLATVLGVAHRRTVRQLRSWKRGELHGEAVAISPNFGPAVVGVFRTTVVLPQWTLELTPHEQQLVLQHELEHIRAGDQFVLLAGVLLSVLMPWNVAVWWQLRRLRIGMELDCDARVAPTPRERPRYADLLLHARRLRPAQQTALGFVSMRSALAERLFALLDRRQPTGTQMTAWSVSAVACTAMLVRVPVPDVRPAFASRVNEVAGSTRAAVVPPRQPSSAFAHSVPLAVNVSVVSGANTGGARSSHSTNKQPRASAPAKRAAGTGESQRQVRYDVLQPFDIDRLIAAAQRQQCATCGKATGGLGVRGGRAVRAVPSDSVLLNAAPFTSDTLGLASGAAAAGRPIGPDSLPAGN